MVMLRAKWFVMGVPVGFWWGWKKSNVWEMEKVVESVLPGPVARHVVDLLPKGTADARQKARLQESIRKQEETIRSLKENAARQEARQEQTNRLLQAVLARLPEADDQRLAQGKGSPPTTTTRPASLPPSPKQ